MTEEKLILEELKQLFEDKGFEVKQVEKRIFNIRLYIGNREGFVDFHLSFEDIEESVLDIKPLYNMYIKRFLENIKNLLIEELN